MSDKERKPLDTDFLQTITFEDYPFGDEVPAEIGVYDIYGNEVAHVVNEEQ